MTDYGDYSKPKIIYWSLNYDELYMFYYYIDIGDYTRITSNWKLETVS